MMLRAVSVLALLSALSSAQDLGVPLTWREYSNSRPLSERISISQNAINTITGQLVSSTGQFNGIGYWQSGNVWSAMANQDHIAGTTVNQAAVTSGLNTAFRLYAHYDEYGWWATAAYYAYRAYGDQNLLNHAIDVWNHVSQYVITSSAAASGSLSTKNGAIAGSCYGSTMAGGVFWRPDPNDYGINSITTGLYTTLSAYLAEATGHSKYTAAAILSATWIKNLQVSNNLILDTVGGQDCSRSPSTWLFTYNTGKYVEGLSVLSDVTGDSQWNTLMVNLVATSVKSTAWEGSDGIITEGSDTTSNNDGVGFKAVFIRGLHEVFTRNAANTNLRILIHSYIDVQYNALLELAANGSSYSANWHGPAQAFTTWGQLASLDVFVSAIDAN